MYSPKISEELIPRIHEAASMSGCPMTVWVNRALERELSSEGPEEQGQEKTNGKEVTEP